jgi:reductive dehalogenase
MTNEDVKKNEKKKGVSRREFLKLSGTIAAGIQVGAAAGAGLAAGKDPSTLTGWQHLGDNTQFVNRKSLAIKDLPYEIIGKTKRPVAVESAFERNSLIMRGIMSAKRAERESKLSPEMQEAPRMGGMRGIQMTMPSPERFPEPMLSYYKQYPERYELDKLRMESIMPKKRKDIQKYGDYYMLIDAWSGAWGTSERITSLPEQSDFQMGGGMGRGRTIGRPAPFKSPKMASKLIKKVAHHFGAAMVGITKLNPDWCYNYSLRGSKDRGPYEVPKHWEYVIAFGIPHQWDQAESNPNAGTSFDAYARVTIAARRLERFIKSLGYPARRHSPMDGYDVIAVPILVDAGLGQQGRHGIVITPETGSNFRAAFVTTNLPMEIDKPIDFGVNEFCQDCKICAEICPSASISFEPNNDKMITRGYRHWEINQTSCYNFWMQSMGGMGCRLCLIACPYSRKNNWVHAMTRTLDTNDPTGIVNNTLTKMQEMFFKAPAAQEYLPPPDGRFATFREPPDWLTVKEYLDIDILDPTKGE